MFIPLDPSEIYENPSEILGKSSFLTNYRSICFFNNNLFNIEYLSLQVIFILINIEEKEEERLFGKINVHYA